MLERAQEIRISIFSAKAGKRAQVQIRTAFPSESDLGDALLEVTPRHLITKDIALLRFR
jgi:hypothetical protein